LIYNIIKSAIQDLKLKKNVSARIELLPKRQTKKSCPKITFRTAFLISNLG